MAVRTSDGTRRWSTSTKEWGSTGKYGIYLSSPAISANGRRLRIGTKAGVLVAFDLHCSLQPLAFGVVSVTTPSDGKMGEESAADMPRRRILLGCLVLMLAVALLPEHV